MLLDSDLLTRSQHIPKGMHDEVTTLSTTNLVTNGTFDSDTAWDKTGNAVISGGVATLNPITHPSLGTISPTSALSVEIGVAYAIQMDATLKNSQNTVEMGGSSYTITGTGSNSNIIIASSTADLVITLETVATKNPICTVDNVEIYKIGKIEGYSVMIGGLLSGGIALTSDDSSKIGSAGSGMRGIHLGQPSSSRSLPDFTGLSFFYTNGDVYFGNDNVFPGYYVQKTVVHDSTASDNSDDITNLYQGDSFYKKVSLMYLIEDDGTNGVEIGAGASDPSPLFFNGRFRMKMDSPNDKFLIDGDVTTGVPIVEFSLNSTTVQECVRPDTDGKIDLGDDANTLRWRRGYFSDLVQVANQINVGTTKVVGAQGSAISNAQTAHDLNATFSDTEVEAALNALGTAINNILSRLRTHGLIAT